MARDMGNTYSRLCRLKTWGTVEAYPESGEHERVHTDLWAPASMDAGGDKEEYEEADDNIKQSNRECTVWTYLGREVLGGQVSNIEEKFTSEQILPRIWTCMEFHLRNNRIILKMSCM